MINKFFPISIVIGTSLVMMMHLPKATAADPRLERIVEGCNRKAETQGLTPDEVQFCQRAIQALNDSELEELKVQAYKDGINRTVQILEDAANAHVGN